MTTTTMTSLMQFAEVWVPESDGIWMCKEATYSDATWKPEAERLAVFSVISSTNVSSVVALVADAVEQTRRRCLGHVGSLTHL